MGKEGSKEEHMLFDFGTTQAGTGNFLFRVRRRKKAVSP